MFQYVRFNRIERIGRVGEAPSGEILFGPLYERGARGIISKLDRYTALVVRRACRFGAKLAATESAQSR